MKRLTAIAAGALACAMGAPHAAPFEHGSALRVFLPRFETADKPRLHELRVTHLFRKEGGDWKPVHRHADPLMAKTAPDAVFSPR